MIHPTFPNESLDMYISKLYVNEKNILDSNKIKAIYEEKNYFYAQFLYSSLGISHCE